MDMPVGARAGTGKGAAQRHLAATEPAFAALIRRVGPLRLVPDRRREPYQALFRAIAHQQLHARAAEAILDRFLALHPEGAFPAPADVLAMPEATLRSCGFSASKIAALRDLSARAEDGTVPNRRAATRLDDEALITRLTTIRGIGRWTVEMLLIFSLGRPDVLPVDDYGVREGWRLINELATQPRPRELAERGRAWSPFRSAAAWYLWRAADEAKAIRPPPVTV